MDVIERTKKKELEGLIASTVGSFLDFAERKNKWKNVTDHCLIEAARAFIFADLLGFDAELKRDLVLASLLHDGHKDREIAAIQEALSNGMSSNVAVRKYLEELRRKGVSSRVINFISFVGGAPEVLFEVKKILEKHQSLSDEEIASLIAHYIDDYTINGEWVKPMERMPSGDFMNDVDRRMERNNNNPNYKEIANEDSRVLESLRIFPGKGLFEIMAIMSHEIEVRIAQLIKNHAKIDPISIPETIDEKIKEYLSRRNVGADSF
jgi:uncharacterized protein YoaH (UPF0181 family)